MDAALILANVRRLIDLQPDEEQAFLALLQPRQVRRKAALLATGGTCTESLFVVEGCLRSFTVDADGAEHVLSFAPPGWWMADLYSLVSGRPALLNIQALEDTQMWVLSRADQETLFARVPKFERFFRILVERSLVAYQQRLLDQTTLPAEERYQKFCSYYPTLVHTLPQKQIASFIGVTPEFFSKMRTALLRRD